MRGNAEILVLGPAALGQAVADALPRCKSVALEDLLGGLWTAGHRPFDGVLVSFSLGRRVLPAIRSLRQIAPAARIVVTCSAEEEPNARAALEAGADDYVLEPVVRQDLEHALGIAGLPRNDGGPPTLPSVTEVLHLSDVLKHLGEGTQAALNRLAELLRAAFDAEGVALHVDDLTATAGTAAEPVLHEDIRRQEAVVGRILLGRGRQGGYSATDATRLTNYARLIETIVAQAQEREHWQDLAWRDDLSGLRNRRYFDATLEQLIGRARAQRLRVTVLLFDIDDFKTYNDHYGHDTGDALLREVATLLTHCSREQDVVARYGGDEFAVILWDAEKPRVPGSQHPAEPVALADRLRAAIKAHDFKCLGQRAPGPVTISGGLACFPWDGKTPTEVMRAADTGLLAAKRTGKNRIALANGAPHAPDASPPDASARRETAATDDLEHAGGE